jgi:hypothetical protein
MYIHLQALERAYGCKLCIGPCVTRGEGFYYDAYYGDVTLNEAHFGLIQAQARKAVDVCYLFNSIYPTFVIFTCYFVDTLSTSMSCVLNLKKMSCYLT